MKTLTRLYRVISGDFVTTEDGTGIVHIAPTFVRMMRAWRLKAVCRRCSS